MQKMWSMSFSVKLQNGKNLKNTASFCPLSNWNNTFHYSGIHKTF